MKAAYFQHFSSRHSAEKARAAWYNRTMSEQTGTGKTAAPEPDFTALSIQQMCHLLEEQTALIRQLTEDNRHLHEQVDYLTRKLFAPKSEKNRECDGQLSMFDEAEKESDLTATTEGGKITVKYDRIRKPKATHDETMGDLPELERTVDLPEDRMHCTICGTKLEWMGREFVRDEIEVVPRKAVRVRIYRNVYGCPGCRKDADESSIVKADVPAALIPHSYATPSAVVLAMYSKYAMGMPLYRQEKDWQQIGVQVNRTTLANWVVYCGINYILPVVDRIHGEMMQRDIIYCDETPVQVLHEDGRTAEQKSYVWLSCVSREDGSPPAVIYSYRPTREGKNAEEILEGFKGHYLVCDGYQGYNRVSGVVRCGCLAHIRRKFVDAIQKKDGKAVPGTPGFQGREFCDTLFLWERKYAGLPPDQKKLKRLEHEKPVLEAFWAWLDKQNPESGSRLDKAVTYARNQRAFMENYLLDGRIEISNQISENSVRPFAVGRRNWLFSDSTNGAVASTAIYSLIETAKLNDLRIKPYLTEVLKFMRDHANGSGRMDLDGILPWAKPMQEKYNLSVKLKVDEDILKSLE